MEVYFGTNFWDDRKAGAPLAKIPVHGAAEGDMLAWENKKSAHPRSICRTGRGCP